MKFQGKVCLCLPTYLLRFVVYRWVECAPHFCFNFYLRPGTDYRTFELDLLTNTTNWHWIRTPTSITNTKIIGYSHRTLTSSAHDYFGFLSHWTLLDLSWLNGTKWHLPVLILIVIILGVKNLCFDSLPEIRLVYNFGYKIAVRP